MMYLGICRKTPTFTVTLCSLTFLLIVILYINKSTILSASELQRMEIEGAVVFESHRNNVCGNGTRRDYPCVIIIGSQKCGTEALSVFLNAHPQLVSNVDEIAFFTNKFSSNFQHYKDRMPCVPKGIHAIDRTADYFVSHQAAGRVAQYEQHTGKPVKMILVLRDPTQRLISHYQWQVQKAGNRMNKQITSKQFEKYIFENGKIKQTPLVHRSIYVKHMSRWLKRFRLNQFLIVKSEEFLSDPVPVLQEIETFLDLPPVISEEHVYYNQTRGFYCVKLDGGDTCLRSKKGRKHPAIEQHVIDQLNSFYKPYNEQLYKLIGRDMKWYN